MSPQIKKQWEKPSTDAKGRNKTPPPFPHNTYQKKKKITKQLHTAFLASN